MARILPLCAVATLVCAVSAFVPQTPTLSTLRRQSSCAISMSAGENSVSRRSALFSIPAVFFAASQVVCFGICKKITLLTCNGTFVISTTFWQSAGAYDFSKLRESGRFADEAPVGTKPAAPPAPAPEPVKVPFGWTIR